MSRTSRTPVGLLGLLALFTMTIAVTIAGTVAPAQAAVPSKKAWVSDVDSAMAGSGRYIENRAQRAGSRLAVNFDIDNTTLATHYDPGAPVARVLRFARHARSLGIALVFNTARTQGGGNLKSARHQLEAAGYDVAAICGRAKGEALAHSKTRCRKRFVDAGYTLVANVGNRATDFEGGYYERAFRLPNYGNQLS